MIESVDKLREWSRWLDCTYATDDGKSYIVYSHQPYDGMKSCGEYMREQCDEIESEIERDYMPVPVDADGIPIRVGDVVEANDWSSKRTVDSFAVVCRDAEGYRVWHGANELRHVKPRTLEDVLKELASDVRKEWINKAPIAEHTYTEYAAEILELLGGDAE